MGNTSSSAEGPSSTSCPVDPAAREAMLTAAKVDQSPSPFPHPTLPAASRPTPPRLLKKRPLAQDREVSSIPRAEYSPQTTTPSPKSPLAAPSSEGVSPNAPSTGNWIYPSEKMFFEAMRRKNYSPNASDMASVVPIHNAVNERAWSEITGWERQFAGSEYDKCDGPKLQSFSGDSTKLSPRARLYALVGYAKPFDRHDWIVQRCEGNLVEYVIDFYHGRGGGLNFYLDVRPKLNTWEGWRMRIGRLVGL